MKEVRMYSSPTCSPCKSLKPILQNVCEEMGIKFTVVDGESLGPTILQSMGIRSFPTVFLAEGDEVTGVFHGIKSKAWIEEFLED